MKQLRQLLDSLSKKGKFPVAKRESGINKSDSKVKIHRFAFALQDTSMSSRRKWFMDHIKWLKREDSLCAGSFHEAIGSVLALAQFFAIMPVVGVKSKSADSLRFQWKSYRFAYSCVIFICMLIYAGVTFWITISGDVTFDQIAQFIFYGSGVYGLLSFGMLVSKWPRLMRRWELIEAQLPKYRTQKETRKLAFNMKTLAIIVLSASLVEHALSMISGVYYSIKCLKQSEPLKVLFRTNLFKHLPYSIWLAIAAKWVNILATFSWSYMDLFVMMMGLGLSSSFRRINEDLQRVKGEHMSEDFWALRRTQYRKLADLCTLVDDAISHITLLAFSNNFVFICNQLMWSIRPMPSIPHAIYFYFSLIFLISRTLAVSLFAAAIYDESKKPIDVLRAVPDRSWCTEIRRFSEQVANDTVALTGMRFFYLTRKVILTTASTIITYELVLNQFHTTEVPEKACS